MKIKILVSFSGVHGSFEEGELAELADDAAQSYCNIGYAEQIVEDLAKSEMDEPRRATKKRMVKAKSVNVETL